MTHVIEGLNFKVLFDCNGGSRKRPVAAVCGESCSSGPSTPTSSPPCYLRGGLPAAAEHCDLNAVRRTRENAREAKRNGTHLQKTHSAFMAEPHPKPRPVTKRGGRRRTLPQPRRRDAAERTSRRRPSVAFCSGPFPPERHLSQGWRAKTLFGKCRKRGREWGGKAGRGIC